MSKFFFKGRIDARENYGSYGFNTNRSTKSGTKDSPLALRVKSDQRKHEVELLLKEHELFADIDVDGKQEEHLLELDTLLNKPKAVTIEKTPERNAPCSCGSGKKYKKCCG